MSEIEKMYLLAGIRKGRMSDEDCAEDCLDYECKNCRYSNYPPFTAEKQLSLIKWLAEFSDFGTFSPDAEIDKDTKVKIYGFALIKREKRYYFIDTRFEIALAKCLNNLWVDMPEEEKEQIRKILNE